MVGINAGVSLNPQERVAHFGCQVDTKPTSLFLVIFDGFVKFVRSVLVNDQRLHLYLSLISASTSCAGRRLDFPSSILLSLLSSSASHAASASASCASSSDSISKQASSARSVSGSCRTSCFTLSASSVISYLFLRLT